MRKYILITLLTLVTCVTSLISCNKSLHYSDAEQIVQNQLGSERFQSGKFKWCFKEVIGAEGPYTSDVNSDFKGSGFRMSFGQPGIFSVTGDSGTIEKKYGGVEGVAFMAIPVQNKQFKNAVIVCQSCPVEK